MFNSALVTLETELLHPNRVFIKAIMLEHWWVPNPTSASLHLLTSPYIMGRQGRPQTTTNEPRKRPVSTPHHSTLQARPNLARPKSTTPTATSSQSLPPGAPMIIFAYNHRKMASPIPRSLEVRSVSYSKLITNLKYDQQAVAYAMEAYPGRLSHYSPQDFLFTMKTATKEGAPETVGIAPRTWEGLEPLFRAFSERNSVQVVTIDIELPEIVISHANCDTAPPEYSHRDAKRKLERGILLKEDLEQCLSRLPNLLPASPPRPPLSSLPPSPPVSRTSSRGSQRASSPSRIVSKAKGIFGL